MPSANYILCTNSAKHAQSTWFGLGLNFHSSHRRLLVGQTAFVLSPSTATALTVTYPQPVHKISTTLTDTGRLFSALFTGPITTTTTFIYKNIEKEDA